MPLGLLRFSLCRPSISGWTQCAASSSRAAARWRLPVGSGFGRWLSAGTFCSRVLSPVIGRFPPSICLVICLGHRGLEDTDFIYELGPRRLTIFSNVIGVDLRRCVHFRRTGKRIGYTHTHLRIYAHAHMGAQCSYGPDSALWASFRWASVPVPVPVFLQALHRVQAPWMLEALRAFPSPALKSDSSSNKPWVPLPADGA